MKTLLNYNIPKDRLSFIVRERRAWVTGGGGGGAGCVGCVTLRLCPYKIYLRLYSLRVAVPSPDGKTEWTELKSDTNRVPRRHSNLWKKKCLFIMFFL